MSKPFDFTTIDLSFANLHSIELVVQYLDLVMTANPSREVADVHNFLFDLVNAIKEDRGDA